ncbi:MAG: hypothetical protein ACLGI7_03970 [Gammaproteobacteria bacterium]
MEPEEHIALRPSSPTTVYSDDAKSEWDIGESRVGKSLDRSEGPVPCTDWVPMVDRAAPDQLYFLGLVRRTIARVS